MSDSEKPITVTETYLAALSGDYSGELPAPVTKQHEYLAKICKNQNGLKEDLAKLVDGVTDASLTDEITPINTINGKRVAISDRDNYIWAVDESASSIKTFPVKSGQTYRAYAFGYDRNGFYIGGISTEEDITAWKPIKQKLLCGTDVYPDGYTYHYVEFVSEFDGFIHLTYRTEQADAKLYGIEYKPKQVLDYSYAVIKNGNKYNCLSHEYGNIYKSRIFKHCGANNLFQLSHIGCGTFDGSVYEEQTSFATYKTDIVGPASIGRWSASTGAENGVWSGGNHSVTIDGVSCKTSEETLLKAFCNGIEITNSENGVYLGKATFIAENDLYFAQTITGNTFDGATKAIHEKRRYIIGDDMDVKVSLDILYDEVSFTVYYGMQNFIRGIIDNVEHPTMLTEYNDMTKSVIFNKESKVFYLNRNDGWHFDMILDDVGLANREQLRMDEPYFRTYGYGNISNGKIYQVLVQGKHFPNGTKLMWSGKYKFYHD